MQERQSELSEAEAEMEHELTALAERARRTIEQLVVDQPHATLAIAAATGFVLGGGMTPRRILRIGLALGGPLLTKRLYREAAKLVRDTVEAAEGPGEHAAEPNA